MSMSTNLISGLSSGFDWRSMIDEIIAVEHRPVDLVESRKSEYESQLSEWQSFNTKLLALKTAAEKLADPDDFYVYIANMSSDSSTVDASDLLSVTTSNTASKGSYTVEISNLATAQKLSSASFSSQSDSLGSSYAGDILVNGTVVNIASTDSLADVRDRINNANTGDNPSGVNASIVTYGTNDYRLILTNDATGEEGISLVNGGSTNILENLGFFETASDSYEVKNSITGGAQSDRFTSSTSTIEAILGLNDSQSGSTLTIMDASGTSSNTISIDLASSSLNDIRDAINNNRGSANISASVVTETEDGNTYYRLQVDGIHASTPFSDENNIFETLGLIQGGVGAVVGDKGANAMTTNGQVISTTTTLSDIDGYLSYTAGDQINFTGTDTSGGAVSTAFTINSDSTVQDLLDSIEANYGDVSASVTSDGKIQVVDNTQDTAGSSSLAVTFADSITDGSLDFGFTGASITTLRSRELVTGSDASMTIDGVTVTSSDNIIEDVIPGVTLSLLNQDPGSTTITLNIERDVDGIVANVNDFVEKYNEVATYIYEQSIINDETAETSAVLFGDSTLSSVKSDITSTLTQQVWGVSSELSTLGLIGVNMDEYVDSDVMASQVLLSVDESKLKGYLNTDFNDIRNVFVADGSTSTGDLDYISHSRHTVKGEYTVNITDAATQNTTTSDSGTVGEDETITITLGDSVATVSLTTSMTVDDIMNAINSELNAEYTEILTGSSQLYEGSGGSTSLNSTTTWNNVYINATDSANLVDDDVIAFSGTDRSGSAITGSYKITDITTDTVQGLLTSIESAYNNEVAASIDGSGRIVLTDIQTGSSSLSLTLDYTDAHDLSFGASVSTSNTGGQEGRYAMNVTATVDASDNLKLTNDDYGSSYSFSITESASSDANKLWTSGDQTVNNGVDVAGTINGEAATGSGQTLSGNSGENSIDGLVLLYTGTSTGDVGTVTFTTGVAELFDRTLFNITDPYSGYVAFKQDSLEDSITRLESQIEEMEARLDRKMETLINKFVAMETALSQIQNMSSWLSSQLSSLNNM